MVDVTEYISGGNYLKPEHIEDIKEKIIIISGGEIKEGNYGVEIEVPIQMKAKDYVWTINKTNAKKLVELIKSKNTIDWIGKPIIIKKKLMDVQGKEKEVIRVDSLYNEVTTETIMS